MSGRHSRLGPHAVPAPVPTNSVAQSCPISDHFVGSESDPRSDPIKQPLLDDLVTMVAAAFDELQQRAAHVDGLLHP